jgi:peptide-methionine (S)-S-oxide reductase
MNIPLLALILLPSASPAVTARLDTAVFAGGCFWGVEAVFEHTKGVRDVVSGYAGGREANPTYDQVSSGNTGHAESVQVIYDPAVVSFATLMRVFFSVAHDATELHRQGPDIGRQYRSAIFYRNPAQRREAQAYVAELTRAKYYPRPIVTEIAPLTAFYFAEGYHQDFRVKNPGNPYIVFNDLPKLERFRRVLPELYVEKK